MTFAQKSRQRTLDADAGEHERKDADQAQEEEKVGEEAFDTRARGAEGVDAHEVAIGGFSDLVGQCIDVVRVRSLEKPAVGNA